MKRLCQVCGDRPSLLSGSCEECSGRGCGAVASDIDDVCIGCDCWKSLPRCRTAVRRLWVDNEYGGDPAEFTREVLQAIADGPIMHPLCIYRPCGLLSPAAAAAREARIRRGEPA